jgi:CheY-like chemotaxis protein
MNETKPNLILMAEDDADDRLLMKEALVEGKVKEPVRFVEDGEELMDYLLRRGKYSVPGSCPTPALILLDLNMPRKDGREALREIRAHPDLRRIPVVVFTTSKADSDVNTLYDLGVNSFVPKPYTFEAIVKTIAALAGYWFGIVKLPQRT